MTSRGCAAALLLAALVASGCGSWGFYPGFVSRSPSGESEIRVMRNFPGAAAEYLFRVEVSSPKGTAVIYRNETRAAIGLVEAHWSHDGGAVGLLACNMFNKHLSALVGYDLVHGRVLDGSAFRSVLEEQIRRKYSLPQDADAINWACSEAGNAAYSSHS